LVEATSWKVTTSIPDEVIAFFRVTQSFRPRYDPGFTQLLTETSTMNLTWGKARPARKADYLTAVCILSRKCWNLEFSQSFGPPLPVIERALLASLYSSLPMYKFLTLYVVYRFSGFYLCFYSYVFMHKISLLFPYCLPTPCYDVRCSVCCAVVVELSV
jgi:hypothetical protein